eukprot:TRINITY_DN12560_c0_g1_i13.p1 TRINITY_DN12560_c0_g1~~TRINITY_DN12560_c0_g1_i13.p1  ORF type:complete len:330 (+),score=114.43 TRINITY_DN12560_c0_g1_i13:180-1169(+)
MEVKFTKRKKRPGRDRNELEDTSSEPAIQKLTINPDIFGEEESGNFRPRKKLAQYTPAPSTVSCAYYESSSPYTEEYLEELKQSQKILKPVMSTPNAAGKKLEVIQELSNESESEDEKATRFVPMEMELDDSDKERANEAREFRSSARKRSLPEPDLEEYSVRQGAAEEVSVDEDKVALYRLMCINKNSLILEDDDQDEQLEKWEDEVMARGLGKHKNEREVTGYSSNKHTVKNQLGVLVKDLKKTCESLSIDKVLWNMEGHIEDLKEALENNCGRSEELAKGLGECARRIEQSERNKSLAKERENYYCDLLAYFTDLEDLFGSFICDL